MAELDSLRERQREHHDDIREIRSENHANTTLLARLVLRIEALEKDKEERSGLLKILRNAVIAAFIAALLSAAAIIDGIKGWIAGIGK